MRPGVLAVSAVLALAVAGCAGSGSGKSHHKNTSTGGTGSSAAGVVLPADAFTVPCVPAATGELGKGFLKQSVRYGPVVFDRVLANRGRPADYKPTAPGRFAPTKTLVLVSRGRAAAVAVPRPERHEVSLQFDRSRIQPGNSQPVTAGAAAVIFRSCPGTSASPWIQHPGAVIVAGARCARLIVIPLKPGTHEPIGKRARVKIPYGRKSCARKT